MLSLIKEWIKVLSLSNPNNWEMYFERGWSEEQDYTSKPRRFYRHKKYPYFITNAFIENPLSIVCLVNKFIHDYVNDNLLMNETFYIESE